MPTPQRLQASFSFNGEAPATPGGAPPHLTEWAPERWPVADDWCPVLDPFLVGETDFKPRGVPSTTYGGVWAYGYIGYAWGSTFHPFNKHNHVTTPYLIRRQTEL